VVLLKSASHPAAVLLLAALLKRALYQVPWFVHSDKGANSLNGDGMLSTVPRSAERVDEFVYDPDDPVPSLGGTNLAIDMGVQDQRPVEQRVDVLVYTSARSNNWSRLPVR